VDALSEQNMSRKLVRPNHDDQKAASVDGYVTLRRMVFCYVGGAAAGWSQVFVWITLAALLALSTTEKNGPLV